MANRFWWLILTASGLCGPALPSGHAAEPAGPELILPLGHTGFVNSVALSRDGKQILTASEDKTAILWDTDTGKPVQTFKGHTRDITRAELSADGKRVLTVCKDNTVILWDVQTGKQLQTVKVEDPGYYAEVALSKDGKRFLTSSQNKPMILWDADTGKPLRTFKDHPLHIVSMVFSEDGKRVLAGVADESAVLSDCETGKPIQTFKVDSKTRVHAALSGDGKYVGTTTDKTTKLFSVAAGKQVQTLKGHTDLVYHVALSGDGKRVLTGSADRTAILWDGESGWPLQTFRPRDRSGFGGVTAVALSDDGKRVFTASMDEYTVTQWDGETGRVVQTFKRQATPIEFMALSEDGKKVLTPAGYKTASLWEIETARLIQNFKGHTASLMCVALTPDGKRALTAGYDKTAILWDSETGKPLQTFRGHTGWVGSVALSSDGKRALTGGSAADNLAILWDGVTGKQLQTFKVEAGSGYKIYVALSRDGKRVYTSSGKAYPTLWDGETGKQLQEFKDRQANFPTEDFPGARGLETFHAPDGEVYLAAFGPKRAFVVTSSQDGTLRVWKPGRQKELFGLLQVGDEWLSWTPEGYYTCSPNGENLVAWKIKDQESPQGYRIVGPEQFRKQFHRPDLFRHLLRELDLTKALALADKESKRTIEPPTNLARALPPVVLITRPEKDGDLDGENLTVEAVAVSVGEHPVTRLRLLLDGRPYQGNLSTFNVHEPKLGKVKWSKQIDLEPGEHTVQVIAESAVSEGRSDIVRIRRKATTESLPRLFVLTVGISAYDKESLRKGVYYCAADARKFADVVEQSSKPLYREVQVVRLLDQDATRKKILQALAQLRKQATQRDAVLIFFAGHGKRDEQTNFYFLPVEADLDDLDATGLSEGDFKKSVKALPGKVILLLDACHSGALIENDRRTDEGLTDRLYRDLTSNEYGLVVMCSSKGGEVSKESNDHKSGLFTLALVEGLTGKARKSSEGAIYLKALDDYVTERVKDLSEGKQHPLTRQPTTISNIPLTRP